VVLLTGIPGAGKTSSVLSGGVIARPYRMIFEGQLSNVATTTEKIQQVIDAGLKPHIIAVHARPENALENTFKRFNEVGRGASINVMSAIQGGLPDSLSKIYAKFGNAVELTVYDYRDRLNPIPLPGWDHLALLKSEGNHEQIRQRLKAALERHYQAGTISAACYAQANGDAPVDRSEGLGTTSYDKHEENGSGRRVPAGDCEKTVLNGTLEIRRYAKENSLTIIENISGAPLTGRVLALTETHLLQNAGSQNARIHEIGPLGLTTDQREALAVGRQCEVVYRASSGCQVDVEGADKDHNRGTGMMRLGI
jgi:hypothetical protein